MFTGIAWGNVGFAIASALLVFVCNPLLYIGLGLTLWDHSRNGDFERRFFGVRVTKAFTAVCRLWIYSILLGMIGTIIVLGAGFSVTTREIVLVTGLSILLGIIRVRFLSPIYSIAMAIGLSLLSRMVHVSIPHGQAAVWWGVLKNFHSLSWLGISALSLGLQGLALWMFRHRSTYPVAVLSKRGRAIGAFATRLSFVVPIVVPMHGTAISLGHLGQMWPWLAPEGAITFTALPLLIGHSGLFSASAPETGLKRLWVNDLLVGALMGVVVYIAYRFGDVYGFAAALLGIGVKEWVIYSLQTLENRLDPLYIPSPMGVRVLSTIRGSLAYAMGLQAGEVITHVNQIPVHTPYDLHFAFDQNPAYAKLQVVDLRGETRFVGNPVYSGERNRLGLILVPDGHSGACVKPVKGGLYQTCYLRLAHQARNPEGAWLESATTPPGN